MSWIKYAEKSNWCKKCRSLMGARVNRLLVRCIWSTGWRWAVCWPGSGCSWRCSSWPLSPPSPGSRIIAITPQTSWPAPCSASPSPWWPPQGSSMRWSGTRKARKQRNKLDSWDGQLVTAAGEHLKRKSDKTKNAIISAVMRCKWHLY